MRDYYQVDPAQEFNNPTDIYNRAANWELSGLDSETAYRLSSKDQLRILGFVVGRGRVLCDWQKGLAFNVVSACFGTDTTHTACYDLRTGERLY